MKTWTLLGMSVILLSTSVGAAQLAIVDVDSTPLYENPNTLSKVQIRLKKGQKVAASTYPLNGYYKVRTGKGMIGWVTTNVLILRNPNETKKSSEIPTF
jgi:uncharacterized protein YgiM (DUF1202 family)